VKTYNLKRQMSTRPTCINAKSRIINRCRSAGRGLLGALGSWHSAIVPPLNTGLGHTLMPHLHQDTCFRIQVVSTCCRLHVSGIVASLLPVCCWIERDTNRLWHKWIVIMSLRYSPQVSRTSNMYPATCVRRHICIRILVARPGHMLPGDMCPGVNAA